MRISVIRLVTSCVILLGGVATPSVAQTLFTPPSQSVHWDRYTIPEFCKAAMDRELLRLQWDLRVDTIPRSFFDTLPSEAVATARRCLTHLHISQVETRSLPVLLQLALMANADSLVDSIIARQLIEAPPFPKWKRARIVNNALRIISTARPLRVSLAERYVAFIDSAWPGATAERAFTHFGIANHAWMMVDVDRAIKEANLVLELAATPPDEPLDSVEQQQLALVTGLSQLALVQVDLFREGATDSAIAKLLAFQDPLLGASLAPLSGQAWYPITAHDAKVYPVPGQPSLIMMVDGRCGARCYRTYAMLRRIRRQFPALPMLISTATSGHFRSNPPLSVAEEVLVLRDYFQKELALPLPVLVDTVPHMKRPDPDRRRINGLTNTAQQLHISDPYQGTLILTDSKGRVILYNDALLYQANPERENSLVSIIKKMIGSS